MCDTLNKNGRSGQCAPSKTDRWKILIMVVAQLLIVSMAPISVNAMGRLLPPPSSPDIEITCSNPVMKSAPTFLRIPKGSAKYPFTSYCTSPDVPGAMTLRWEGSWTPSHWLPVPYTMSSIPEIGYSSAERGRSTGLHGCMNNTIGE